MLIPLLGRLQPGPRQMSRQRPVHERLGQRPPARDVAARLRTARLTQVFEKLKLCTRERLPAALVVSGARHNCGRRREHPYGRVGRGS